MSREAKKTEPQPVSPKEIVAVGVSEAEKIQAAGGVKLLRVYRETMHGPKLFVYEKE